MFFIYLFIFNNNNLVLFPYHMKCKAFWHANRTQLFPPVYYFFLRATKQCCFSDTRIILNANIKSQKSFSFSLREKSGADFIATKTDLLYFERFKCCVIQKILLQKNVRSSIFSCVWKMWKI